MSRYLYFERRALTSRILQLLNYKLFNANYVRVETFLFMYSEKFTVFNTVLNLSQSTCISSDLKILELNE